MSATLDLLDHLLQLAGLNESDFDEQEYIRLLYNVMEYREQKAEIPERLTNRLLRQTPLLLAAHFRLRQQLRAARELSTTPQLPGLAHAEAESWEPIRQVTHNTSLLPTSHV